MAQSNNANVSGLADNNVRHSEIRFNIADYFLPALQSWPTYNGTNMSIVQFIRELSERANAAEYDESKLARILPLQLTGAAKIKYDNYENDVKAYYRKAVAQLKRDFRSPNYVEIAKSKIYHGKQEPNENVIVFGQHVRDLVEMPTRRAAKLPLKKSHVKHSLEEYFLT
ncbi:hypothetical protein Y032_0142g2329 [Ancylostoma ceylanicum]|uniref:Uncharacterized protein n=1 Tax=Ancylostoma ceylanicum TaxID=53326 RepID=A0A016T3U5_9BILA|nr:hypothetical protein Y032_0142g2329 [Ancylostoma ceylanicum]